MTTMYRLSASHRRIASWIGILVIATAGTSSAYDERAPSPAFRLPIHWPLPPPPPPNGAAVVWDLGNDFILAGTGCNKNVDAFAAANGNDVSIVFTNLGVNLPGGGGGVLADQSACLARIPTTIAAGLYVGELTQVFTYGVTKSAYTSGAVSTVSTFFGFDVSPFTWSVPFGQTMNEPLVTEQRQDEFLVASPWYQGWCNPNRGIAGFYEADISVSGQRSTQNDNLILFVDGLDLKYEVLLSLAAC